MDMATRSFGMSSIMTRRSKLTLVLTCVALFCDRAEGVGLQIDAITKPLHENFTMLEARGTTLDAPADLSTVRVNHLKKDLEEEQKDVRDKMERSQFDDYPVHKDETSHFDDQSQAKAQSPLSEGAYQKLLLLEKAKTAYLEQQLTLKDIEIFELQEQLAVLRSPSIQRLAEPSDGVMAVEGSIVKDQHHEIQMDDSDRGPSIRVEAVPPTPGCVETAVSVVRSFFVGVKNCFLWVRDVFVPQVLRFWWMLCSFVRDVFSRLYRAVILLHVGGKKLILFVLNCFRFLHHDVAPMVQHYWGKLLTTVCQGTSGSYWAAKTAATWLHEFAQSSIQGVKEVVRLFDTYGIRIVFVPLAHLLSKLGDSISTTFSKTWDLLWQGLSAYLNESQILAFTMFSRSLQIAHQLVVDVFEFLAVAASTYFIRGLSGTRDHWFYKYCLSAKLNSGTILVLLEVVAGLIFMELAFAVSHRKKGRRARDSAKLRGQSIAVSIGKKPAPSLLKSSAGRSRSERSSEFFYTFSLD